MTRREPKLHAVLKDFMAHFDDCQIDGISLVWSEIEGNYEDGVRLVRQQSQGFSHEGLKELYSNMLGSPELKAIKLDG